MHETAVAALTAHLFSPTCRWCVPNGFAKRPISQCDSAHFTTQNGPFYSAKWAVLQHTMYQCVTRTNFSCGFSPYYFTIHPRHLRHQWQRIRFMTWRVSCSQQVMATPCRQPSGHACGAVTHGREGKMCMQRQNKWGFLS